MVTLTNVFLHGRLGKLYGHEWKLAVKSPAEAIRAINVNTNSSLKNYLLGEGAKKYYKVCLGNKNNAIDKTEVPNPSGQTDIHIVPVPKGRGSGAAKIIAGIALIGLSMIPGVGPALAFGSMTAGQVTFGIAMLGASLVLGGITQLLTPIPNFNNNTDGDGRGSNLFQGNSSIATQGSTVGLVYGRMMVTPMPVAVAFDNYEQGGTPNNFSTTEYTSYYDENGVLVQIPVVPPGTEVP